jgi:hypothetical protein
MGPGWGQLTAEESSLQEQDKGARRAPLPVPTVRSLPTSVQQIFSKKDSGARLPWVRARLYHLLLV